MNQMHRWMTLCEADASFVPSDYLQRLRVFLPKWKLCKRQCSDIIDLYTTTHGRLYRGIRAD
jgi:hypothetical protein